MSRWVFNTVDRSEAVFHIGGVEIVVCGSPGEGYALRVYDTRPNRKELVKEAESVDLSALLQVLDDVSYVVESGFSAEELLGELVDAEPE